MATTPNMAMLGATGAEVPHEEHLPALRGDRWYRVVHEMTEEDPIIAAILFAVEMLIRRVEWSLAPASDAPEDQDVRQFVDECLFKDLDPDWEETLSEILSFLPYGWCLPGDQAVLDAHGVPTPIAEIQPGDAVLTKEGRARPVERVYRRPFTGELVSLQIRGYPDAIRLTPEHRVPTADGWKRADQLAAGDYLLRPRLEMTDGGNYLAGWIVGAYLAEGHRPKDKLTQVWFSVNPDVADELADNLHQFASENNLINRRGRLAHACISRREGRGAAVTIYHPEIRGLIDTWVEGDRAHTKRLRTLPSDREFARGVWEGWLWGDGHDGMHPKSDGRSYRVADAATVSDTLASQMQLIGGTLGFPAAWKRRGPVEGHVIKGRGVSSRAANIIGAMPPKVIAWKRTPEREKQVQALRASGMTLHAIADRCDLSYPTVWKWLNSDGPKTQGLQCHVGDDAVEHEVLQTQREYFNGEVYDLQVAEDHTFCAGPVAVSNCLLEVNYKRRGGETSDPATTSRFTDGRIGWRSWAIRPQETRHEWTFADDGTVEAMVQVAPPKYVPVSIPLDKALLFRTTTRQGRPEGPSILRAAYQPWFYKREIQKYEAVGIERDLAGLPVAWVPAQIMSDTATPAEKQVLASITKIVTNMRRNQQEGVVMPLVYDQRGNKQYDLELLTAGGQRQFDTGAIIDRYNTLMAMSILADFVTVGHEQTGTYSMLSGKVDMFVTALESWLDAIAAVVNEQAIGPLLRYNGIPAERAPRLTPGSVMPRDLAAMGAYLTSLAQSGVLKVTEELQQYVLEIAGLPVAKETGE